MLLKKFVVIKIINFISLKINGRRNLYYKKNKIEHKFKIIKEISSCGEAMVFEVKNKSDNTKHAARTLTPYEEEDNKKFWHEVKYLETLNKDNCPYIIKYITYLKHKEGTFIKEVSSYVDDFKNEK